MDLGDGLGRLTYSWEGHGGFQGARWGQISLTNPYSTPVTVHPGETWDDMNASVRKYCPELKHAVSPNAPFAVSLRLSGQSAEAGWS